MWSLYEIGIRLLSYLSLVLSLLDPKVRKWIKGRKLQNLSSHNNPILIHCASLGEYLQAKPLIELLKAEHKEIVLSFFSPSGFDNVTGYDKYYLPIDTYQQAKRFITTIDPSLVILVRSEFWFNHLKVLQEKNIPVVVMNCLMTPDHYYFKSWGHWFLSQIKKVNFFYTIDQRTNKLLRSNEIENGLFTGDTKVDQVLTTFIDKEALINISTEKKIIIAGSVEKDDRTMVTNLIKNFKDKYLIIIVPHESSDHSFNYYQKISEGSLKKYSAGNLQSENIIYIDVHGILASLYTKAWISYIGGGFGKGVHNILEPCVTECPIVFGPAHNKFPEAKKLIELKAAKEIKNQNDLISAVNYFEQESNYSSAKNACRSYIDGHKGATMILFNHLKQNGFI